MTKFEILILCFVIVSAVSSLTSIIFIIVDSVLERRDENKSKDRSPRPNTEPKRSGIGTREGVLIGVGVLSLLGNLMIARSINKKSYKSEERRRWKW